MRCPIDGTTLVITDRSGIEIDYCPQCRGVWLDRGELDKLIERSAVYAAPGAGASRDGTRQARDDDRRSRDDDRRSRDDDRRGRDDRGRKKRKSGLGDFIEDIFDF